MVSPNLPFLLPYFGSSRFIGESLQEGNPLTLGTTFGIDSEGSSEPKSCLYVCDVSVGYPYRWWGNAFGSPYGMGRDTWEMPSGWWEFIHGPSCGWWAFTQGSPCGRWGFTHRLCSGYLVWRKVPPGGVSPSPELGRVTGSSGVGPLQNRGLLRESEWSQGSRKCGVVVSCSIGKDYQEERDILASIIRTGR